MALPLRSLTPAPPDPILGLTETFRADPRPEKVNLAVGVYVDDTGVTPIIPSVLEAERRLLEKAGHRIDAIADLLPRLVDVRIGLGQQ